MKSTYSTYYEIVISKTKHMNHKKVELFFLKLSLHGFVSTLRLRHVSCIRVYCNKASVTAVQTWWWQRSLCFHYARTFKPPFFDKLMQKSFTKYPLHQLDLTMI